jgi:hypothetical protein
MKESLRNALEHILQKDGYIPEIKKKTDNDILNEFAVTTRFHSNEFEKCLCGHLIKEECLIVHKKTKKIYIVGNECINQFSSCPLCTECEIYESTSYTAKLCKFCKTKNKPSHTVRLKKHKGKSYKDAWFSDPKWCEWVCEKMDPKYDPHFVEFLKKIKQGIIYGELI